MYKGSNVDRDYILRLQCWKETYTFTTVSIDAVMLSIQLA